MSLVQNAVGDDLYVWTKTPGKPSAGTTECVISAHGGQSIINSTFTVKGVKLVFYAPHGYSLSDPGIDAVITRSIKPNEEVVGGNCQDYVLSKYQGSHNKAGETYDTIRNSNNYLEDKLNETRDMMGGAAEMLMKNPDAEKMVMQQLDIGAEWLSRYSQWMDVVTIRNRKLQSDPMLSEVIEKLRAGGYGYTTIHCSFCRSPRLNVFADKGAYVAPRA